MRTVPLSTFESIVIGVIVGVSSPVSLGGISSWRWWVYIILMNIILDMAYSVGKAWWLDRHIRKARANKDGA